MVALHGFTEHLSEFLHERGADNIAERLEAVEASTRRIEAMLRRISQDMGDDCSEISERPHPSRTESSDAFEAGDSP